MEVEAWDGEPACNPYEVNGTKIISGVKVCQKEMEQDLHAVRHRGEAGWGAHAPGLVLAENVSARDVGPKYPIK